MNSELFTRSVQPLQQRDQRGAAPRRHRQPGSAGARSAGCSVRRSSLPTTSSGPTAIRTSGSAPSWSRCRWSRSSSKVPEPSPATSRLFTTSTRTFSPTPRRETPGFKVPRQVQVEILSIDGNALAARHTRQADRGGAPLLLRKPQVGVRGSFGIAQGSVRRPARPDASDHPAVLRSERHPGPQARRGEGPGRDPRQVHEDQGNRDDSRSPTSTWRRSTNRRRPRSKAALPRSTSTSRTSSRWPSARG